MKKVLAVLLSIVVCICLVTYCFDMSDGILMPSIENVLLLDRDRVCDVVGSVRMFSTPNIFDHLGFVKDLDGEKFMTVDTSIISKVSYKVTDEFYMIAHVVRVDSG